MGSCLSSKQSVPSRPLVRVPRTTMGSRTTVFIDPVAENSLKQSDDNISIKPKYILRNELKTIIIPEVQRVLIPMMIDLLRHEIELTIIPEVQRVILPQVGEVMRYYKPIRRSPSM
jgi:hypothetical protein